jgi:hypothetical protein
MKKLKYIFYILTTMLLTGCNDDEGYVYETLYDIVFTSEQPILTKTNLPAQATYNISKIKGQNNYYEFTIDQTDEFNDFKVNGTAFAPNEYVKIDNFTDNNTITFTAIKAGEYEIPVKIKFCGVETKYSIKVTVSNDAGLVLGVSEILKEGNNVNGFVPSDGLFNVENYKPILKFDGLTLVDNETNKTWQLSITSQNDNIQKITYRGNDYAPGEYFDFDPAFARELSVVPKDGTNLTFGDDKLIFNAKNNDGTTSNTVEKDIKFYELDITFNTNLTRDADGYYDMAAFYELIPTYYYTENNKNQGVNVSRQDLKHNIGLHFEGKGVKLKSIVFEYGMTRANSDTTSNVTYAYTNVLDQQVYDIAENSSIILRGGGYSGTDRPTSEYTSTGKLIVTTEFDDVYEFKFRTTKSNIYIMWFNNANVFEGNLACDANYGDPDCDASQLPPLY